jgi:hypothetical protein
MTFELKTADGKPISTEGVDAKIVALMTAVGEAISTRVEAASNAANEGLTEAVTAAVTAAVEPISTEIEAIKKAKPGEPDPKPGDTPNDEPPVWATKLMDTVNGLAAEREAEKQQGTVSTLVKSYLDKNLPNLGDARVVIERRLVAAAPKDEAAIKSAADAIREEYKAVGAEGKIFDADPAKEGATDEPKDDAERDKKDKLELLSKPRPLAGIL